MIPKTEKCKGCGSRRTVIERIITDYMGFEHGAGETEVCLTSHMHSVDAAKEFLEGVTETVTKPCLFFTDLSKVRNWKIKKI